MPQIQLMARGKRDEFQRWWDGFWAFVSDRSGGTWLFRGQGPLARHPLIPSIGRTSIGLYSKARELELFHEFKRRARLFEPGAGFSDWEWLALAQHFGVPTRLLDWSANPLVAAYFACCIQENGMDGQIVAFRDDAIPTIKDTDTPFGITGVRLVQVSALAARITSQRGAFTIQGDPLEPMDSLILSENRLTIPVRLKPEVMRRLFILGVDASHILADMEGLGQMLAWRYKHQIPFQSGAL